MFKKHTFPLGDTHLGLPLSRGHPFRGIRLGDIRGFRLGDIRVIRLGDIRGIRLGDIRDIRLGDILSGTSSTFVSGTSGHPSQGHSSQGHPFQGHPSQGHPFRGIRLGLSQSRGHPFGRHSSRGHSSQTGKAMTNDTDLHRNLAACIVRRERSAMECQKEQNHKEEKRIRNSP